jgi:L-asparaginase II
MPSYVFVYRGDLVESQHRVSFCVVRPDGRTVAASGDPSLVTFWRSAAKPFQAVPIITEGAAAGYGISDAELALACASHNGEPRHVAVAHELLRRSGATVDDLVCGPHPSLNDAVAKEMARRGEAPTRAHSNCSGKHAGMIALGRWKGWGSAGYERPGHDVQRRCLAEVARWADLHETMVDHATDGCGVPSFALPLHHMAVAYARLAAAAAGDDGPGAPADAREAAARLVAAIRADPFLLAGTARLDTDLVTASEGRVLAKVGAEGVYCAAIPDLRLGLALKVEDGAWRALAPALLALLEQVAPGCAPGLDAWRTPTLKNTRGAVVGEVVARVEMDRSA